MHKNRRLRELIDRADIVVAPGVYDPFVARLVAEAGFEAAYMTGSGVSHVRLGMPDLGLLTFSEMVDQAARIADVIEIPLIADADTGYGNALNVMRTIKAYERAGVSGCHIEDQASPKRCGHFAGKQLIALGEMCGKLQAALDARLDPDFVIIARTDARTVLGVEEALDRARAFVEIGADMVFVESPRSEEELALIGTSIDAPLLANMVEGGLTPVLPAARLQELGFSVSIHAGAVARFVGKQVREFLRRFKAEGATLSQADLMLDIGTQNEIVELARFLERAKRYEPGG